jgi:hypothetical protein
MNSANYNITSSTNLENITNNEININPNNENVSNNENETLIFLFDKSCTIYQVSSINETILNSSKYLQLIKYL